MRHHGMRCAMTRTTRPARRSTMTCALMRALCGLAVAALLACARREGAAPGAGLSASGPEVHDAGLAAPGAGAQTPTAAGPADAVTASRPAGTPTAAVEVRTWGSLREVMHGGGQEAVVAVSEVARPHVWGVGALAGLRGEVTLVDGQVWLSRGDGRGGVRVERSAGGAAPAVGAALLTVATVERWQRVALTRDVEDGALDAEVERLARDAGLDVERPFPLVVEGELQSVHWHVLDPSRPPAGGAHGHAGAVSGVLPQVRGRLVGFFSRHHAGVFTHHDRATHLHLVTGDGAVMGHADRAGWRAGASLLLPAR